MNLTRIGQLIGSQEWLNWQARSEIDVPSNINKKQQRIDKWTQAACVIKSTESEFATPTTAARNCRQWEWQRKRLNIWFSATLTSSTVRSIIWSLNQCVETWTQIHEALWGGCVHWVSCSGEFREKIPEFYIIFVDNREWEWRVEIVQKGVMDV